MVLLKDAQLEEIVSQFISTALRAEKAGFDGVQLHFAHGYFLSKAISPATNHREDKWGGSEEKRFYIAQRIISGIRKGLADYPLLVKTHGDDPLSHG